MKLLIGVTLLLGFWNAGVAADSADIYQSELGAPLGRIFSSSAERRRLDQQRVAGPHGAESAAAPPGDSVVTEAKSRQPAGYIIGKTGARSAWVDGDFRKQADDASGKTMHFPGSIAITTHKPRALDAENDDRISGAADSAGDAENGDPGQSDED